VPADDDPGKRHDDRFVQQVEREHGLVGVTGGALPPRLACRRGPWRCRAGAAAAGGERGGEPGDGCQPGPAGQALQRGPARLGPAHHAGPGRDGPAQQPDGRCSRGGHGQPPGPGQRGLEPGVAGDQEPVQEGEHVCQPLPAAGDAAAPPRSPGRSRRRARTAHRAGGIRAGRGARGRTSAAPAAPGRSRTGSPAGPAARRRTPTRCGTAWRSARPSPRPGTATASPTATPTP